MPIHSHLFRRRRLSLWKRREPQNGETGGDKRIESKGQCWQKHHRLQSGGRSCTGRQESTAAGCSPPGQPYQDAGLAQAPRIFP